MLIIIGIHNPENFLHIWLWICPLHLKISPLYLVKCSPVSSD